MTSPNTPASRPRASSIIYGRSCVVTFKWLTPRLQYGISRAITVRTVNRWPLQTGARTWVSNSARGFSDGRREWVWDGAPCRNPSPEYGIPWGITPGRGNMCSSLPSGRRLSVNTIFRDAISLYLAEGFQCNLPQICIKRAGISGKVSKVWGHRSRSQRERGQMHFSGWVRTIDIYPLSVSWQDQLIPVHYSIIQRPWSFVRDLCHEEIRGWWWWWFRTSAIPNVVS